MNYNNANVNSNNNNKNNGFSVRCLQDWREKGGKYRPSLFEDLHNAYLDARRNKRKTRNQLTFECNLERELIALETELQNRTYVLLPGICFINETPVKREIVAADFRDRVIHHLMYNWISPIFERQFIHDSYSCRVGKGTLFGIRRAQGFLRAASDDYRKDCWVLRLDIQGFFMAIDRRILHNLVLNGLEKVRWSGIKDVELTKYLLQKIIFNDPLAQATFRSPPQKWIGLPPDKSLIGAPAECGLPIGNLTSQLFANVYLNPLDHYVKRVLKVKYYGRYVDDMLLVHSDKCVLLHSIAAIKAVLQNHLNLTLHPRKIKLQQAFQGFDFLGTRIYPNKLLPGKRVLTNYQNCLWHPLADSAKQLHRLNSYKGVFKHCRNCLPGSSNRR